MVVILVHDALQRVLEQDQLAARVEFGERVVLLTLKVFHHLIVLFVLFQALLVLHRLFKELFEGCKEVIGGL